MKLVTEILKAKKCIFRALETQHTVKLMAGLVLGAVFLAWALHLAPDNGDEAGNPLSSGRESVSRDQPAVEKDQSKTEAYIMQVEREINLILFDVAHNPSANAEHQNRQIEQRDYLIDMFLMSAISEQ